MKLYSKLLLLQGLAGVILRLTIVSIQRGTCARIKVEFYDEKGNKQVLRLREELAIVFQHEIDHLNGILFYDRIDKKDPFKNANKYRAI